MSARLDGRGAVVTGGGRGIGAEVARALAGSGVRVVVAARTSKEIEQVTAELRAGGSEAWPVRCDVADESSVRELGQKARACLGAVDILVNNAGTGSSAPLGKITLEEWNRTMAANATGVFLCTREFVPGMIQSRWGRVVNVASVAGLSGAKYVAHYSAAKHAVIGFTRSVALELEGTGVSVHAVCPGYVDTPMTERTVANVQSRTGLTHDQALAAVLATTGQERLLRPGEVAAAVVDLCRDDAGLESGRILVLGAGVPTP